MTDTLSSTFLVISLGGEIGLISVYTCSSFHKMLKLITDGKHLAKDSFSANDVDACSNVWVTL